MVSSSFSFAAASGEKNLFFSRKKGERERTVSSLSTGEKKMKEKRRGSSRVFEGKKRICWEEKGKLMNCLWKRGEKKKEKRGAKGV